jgi:hypothetical protein
VILEIASKVFDSIAKKLKILLSGRTNSYTEKSGKFSPGQINGTSGNVTESFRYFYHSDHLGSTSYITDATETYLIDGYWIVTGTFPENADGETFQIIFSAKDGRVVRITHSR